MKKPVFGLLFLLICLTALAVRVVRLDLRPMHHDEANQAVKFGNLLENGEYRYDNTDHHGPSLYYLSLPLVRLITGPDFADTGTFALRLLPALSGMGMIILFLFLADGLSRKGVVFASLLAALSPMVVFYSRFYIQETLLIFFAMGLITAGWRYYRKPSAGWAVLTGFFAGMMYATKETSLIIFAAAIGSLFLTRLTMRRPATAEKPSPQWSHLPAAFGTALFVAILFYSSFFENPAGPVDSLSAFKTYFSKAGAAGFHEHPWYYYLKMLAFSKYGSGPAWSEGLVLILMLTGSVFSFRKKIPAHISPVFLRFIFFHTYLIMAVFSLIPYKTPWNSLPFYSGMILLAGAGAVVIINYFKTGIYRFIVYSLLLVGVVNLSMQCLRANFKYYADNRSPYVYAHTVNDFKRLVARIEDISALHADKYGMLIKVIANPYDTWPLPYYLRKFHKVGYWQDALSAGLLPGVPLIVASLDQDDMIRPILTKNYQAEYYGLRPEALLVVYIRQDLWRLLMKTGRQ
jgi:uncharacterized protein (TIGR03663 family)